MSTEVKPANRFRRVVIGVLLLPIHLLMFLLVGLPFLCLCLFSELMITCTKYGNVNFYPKERIPWVPELESNWMAIRAELDRVLQNVNELPNIQDISPQSALTQDDKWKSYLFNIAGQMDERSCAECPETARLLGEIPDLYFAQFSILTSKKHIPPHRGHYKGVLNCHLALLVPEDREQCRLRVTNEIQTWEEGKVLIFDDRKVHEAWNDADSIRVVLIIHIIRPLPFPLDRLNRWLLKVTRRYSPVVQSVRRKQEEWFEQLDAKKKAADTLDQLPSATV